MHETERMDWIGRYDAIDDDLKQKQKRAVEDAKRALMNEFMSLIDNATTWSKNHVSFVGRVMFHT